jgi:anti-sigma28 factor (negative regulator of flagellin synthesis)
MTQVTIDRELLERAMAALENHSGNYKLSKSEAVSHCAVCTEIFDALQAAPAQPVNQVLVEKLKALADWHEKTSKLWPINMDQSAFHNSAALTLSGIAQAQAQPAQGLTDGEAVQNLIDAVEDLMAWQVKNIKVWNHPTWDTADMRVKQLRAAIQKGQQS